MIRLPSTIKLGSRVWLVFEDFDGYEHDPVIVEPLLLAWLWSREEKNVFILVLGVR